MKILPKISLVVLTILTACRFNGSASDLYDFPASKKVKVLVNIDYKLTSDEGPEIVVEEQDFYLNAYLYDGSATQIPVGYTVDDIKLDLPVTLAGTHSEFSAVVAVPSAFKAGSDGYTIHFSLKEVNASLRLGATKETVKNLDILMKGIQPGLEDAENPVNLSLATTIAFQIAKDVGALEDLAMGKDSYTGILDLVTNQMKDIEATVDPIKSTDLFTFAQAIVASVKLSVANNQALQEEIAAIVNYSSEDKAAQFTTSFTEILKDFVVEANDSLGSSKDTAAARILKTESREAMSIPSPESYTSTIYAPLNVSFSDTDFTSALGGHVSFTAPSSEVGIDSYNVYFGGDTSATGKLKLVGSAVKGTTPLRVTLASGTAEESGGTRFWVYPVSNGAEISLGISTSIVNINKPAGLSYSSPSPSYVAGSLITVNNPSSTGGTIASYTVSPTLPTGLSLNATTGQITGRPTTTQSATTYTVTGSNSSGLTTASIAITVTAAAAASVTLSPPATVISGSGFTLSGTCSGELGAIAVDFANDSAVTAGVSTDPLSCTCENSVFSCPTVTVTYPTFTTQTITYKTTITSAWAGNANHTSSNSTSILKLALSGASVIAPGQTLNPAGTCSPNAATLTLTAPVGFTPASISCACNSGSLSACNDFTESSAVLDTNLTFAASLTSGSSTIQATKTISVGNLPPIALSGESGAGNAYQSGQLGGLSFTRYGHDSPAGNQMSHDEVMDFIDDPIGNADGVRENNTTAQHAYAWGGTSSAGWLESASNDKYADGNGEITPVGGGDFFGDTYRGYFVPPVDGVYKFVAAIPDNAVRLLMSPDECPMNAIAVVSSDLAGNMGAVDPDSTWVNGNGGAYQSSQVYLHNTAAFFPGGSGNTDYENGTTYLSTSKIYYLEIRYAEGGGGNAFSFQMDRRNIGSASWVGPANLSANTMLPYSGADKYVPRQACGGTSYNASNLFSDPESDALEYSARLVTSAGGEISGPGSLITSVGLSFNTTTGVLSGVVNGSFTTQKIIFSARDPGGSNTWTDSSPISLVQ